jgi:hypothetical protein
VDNDVGPEIAPAEANIRFHLSIQSSFGDLLGKLVEQFFRAAAQAVNILADKASLFHLDNPFTTVFLTQLAARIQPRVGKRLL